MKRPVLEVIRFDEADIITSSGSKLGMIANGFENGMQNDATFTFIGGPGGNSGPHSAHADGLLNLFNNYFSCSWSSVDGINYKITGSDSSAEGEFGELILHDREGSMDVDLYKNFNGSFEYRSGSFYRSN